MDKNKISTVFIPQLQLLKSVESLKRSSHSTPYRSCKKLENGWSRRKQYMNPVVTKQLTKELKVEAKQICFWRQCPTSVKHRKREQTWIESLEEIVGQACSWERNFQSMRRTEYCWNWKMSCCAKELRTWVPLSRGIMNSNSKIYKQDSAEFNEENTHKYALT